MRIKSALRSALLALAAIPGLAFASSAQEAPEHAKSGFATFVDDGRLWVFRADSKDLADFKEHGEPVKQATRIGVGPNGMTVKSIDIETIDAYVAAK
jgi:hypothetical protein